MSNWIAVVGGMILATATFAAPAEAAQDEGAADPVRLTAGHPAVDASRLPVGRTSKLMHLGEGAEAQTIGVYSVEVVPRDDDATLIVQTMRTEIGRTVDSVLVRGRRMVPVWYRMYSPRGRLDLRYDDGGRRVRGTEWTAEGEAVPIDATFDEPRYPSTIGMIVLQALPLRSGYAIEMPVSRHGATQRVTARVAARETSEDADGSPHDAWRLEVTFGDRPATRWIGVEDRVELAARAELPNGRIFRQTRVALTESAVRAGERIRDGVDAMGGEAVLRGIGGVRLDAVGHTNMLEQSERPEGPYLIAYEESTILRDPAGGRLRRTVRTRAPQAPGWSPRLTRIVDGDAAALSVGDRTGPDRAAELASARESLALGPERILLTALDAEDVRATPDTVLQGVPHHVVAFTWRGRPVRVFLNAHTRLPTAVERTREHPWDQWSLWGDVTTRTLFSFWTLEPNGLMYPRQWSTERNGMPARELLVTRLELGADAPADSFAIPAEVRSAFHAVPVRGFSDLRLGVDFGGRPTEPREIAPGIVLLPGAWNVTLVRQEDGVVALEAPISSAYTSDVIDEAVRRFGDATTAPSPGGGTDESNVRTSSSSPAAPVLAAVSTSDAWPHIGGVREYVARGVPVYAHALNVPLLRRVVEAPHSYRPDSLALAPRAPVLREVDGPVAVGQGPNRFVLHPVRGEGGERMIAAYFPEHRLLYASDLVQRLPDGTFFMPEYLHEVRLLVEREALDVETVFAMHTAPMPWSEVLAALPRGTS